MVEPAKVPKKRGKAAKLDKAEKARLREEEWQAKKQRAEEEAPRNIAAGTARADKVLQPAIEALIEGCEALYLVPSASGGSAILVGTCSNPKHPRVLSALIALQRMPFIGKSDSMNLTTGYSSVTAENGRSFLVRLVWPGGPSSSLLIDGVRNHIASYPMDILGWRTPLSALDHAKAQAILCTLPRP